MTGARPRLISSSISSLGVRAERAGDREHLLLAARQQAGLAVAAASRSAGKWSNAASICAGGAEAVEPEVLGHGQPEEDAAVRRHVRDAEPGSRGRRHAGEVGAAEPDGSRRVLQQAGDRAQRGRLPRAVGAEQRHHLAVPHGERQVAHDQRAVVAHAQPVELEYRVAASPVVARASLSQRAAAPLSTAPSPPATSSLAMSSKPALPRSLVINLPAGKQQSGRT